MTTRRNFLKLGALWLPAVAAPRVAYSFLRATKPYVWVPVLDEQRLCADQLDAVFYALAAAARLPEWVLRGELHPAERNRIAGTVSI